MNCNTRRMSNVNSVLTVGWSFNVTLLKLLVLQSISSVKSSAKAHTASKITRRSCSFPCKSFGLAAATLFSHIDGAARSSSAN